MAATRMTPAQRKKIAKAASWKRLTPGDGNDGFLRVE
jgi:hypothetical protein